jgi:hypothetical protein
MTIPNCSSTWKNSDEDGHPKEKSAVIFFGYEGMNVLGIDF